MKKEKKRKRSSFTLSFPNGKKLKFRTHETFSAANERLSKGRFSNASQMVECVKLGANGFEYIEPTGKKYATPKGFNQIDFED